MTEFITYPELETVVFTVYNSIFQQDQQALISMRDLILKAQEIDFSIKTKAEYKMGLDLVYDSHNVNRMAIFLLNNFGEFYLNDGIITIYQDDKRQGKTDHTNTYKLVLKDIDTHEKLYKGNPTEADSPYDFDTNFVKQITHYPDGPKDTTSTSWDSFANCYKSPSRKLDFKSAFWTTDSSMHDVDYIIQIPDSGELKLFRPYHRNNPKQFSFQPLNGNLKYLDKYLDLLKYIKLTDNFDMSWSHFIK